jgi:hypothetical protein
MVLPVLRLLLLEEEEGARERPRDAPPCDEREPRWCDVDELLLLLLLRRR